MDDIYRAIADPTRRAILDELAEREGQSLFEICARLTMRHGIGSTRQAVSQHLQVLEAAGLIRTRREGRSKLHWFDSTPLLAIAERWPVPKTQDRHRLMQIHLASVFVDDQQKALRFYTEVLGFEKKTEIPLGEAVWLTVVSAVDRDGTELVLEPDSHPAVKPFKRALVEDGIPFTSFSVPDVQAEYERLDERGVRFVQPPVDMGMVVTAVLDDTCGNLIQIAAKKEAVS